MQLFVPGSGDPRAEVEFIETDATEFRPDGPGDRLLSRFGIMFFERPDAAFANSRSWLSPNGMVVALCQRTVTAHQPQGWLPGSFSATAIAAERHDLAGRSSTLPRARVRCTMTDVTLGRWTVATLIYASCFVACGRSDDATRASDGGDRSRFDTGAGDAGPSSSGASGGASGSGGAQSVADGSSVGQGGRVGSGGAGAGGSAGSAGSAAIDAGPTRDSAPAMDAGGSADAAMDTGLDCPDLPPCGGCPHGFWIDRDGCSTCACAPPPVVLSVGGSARPVEHVAFQASASAFIGAIDRYVFEFTWDYDDPRIVDEAERLVIIMRLQRMSPDVVSETNKTYRYPSDGVLEGASGTYTLFGIGVLEASMVQVAGYLSLRRAADRLVGGVYVELEPATEEFPGTVVAAGAFDVAEPVP